MKILKFNKRVALWVTGSLVLLAAIGFVAFRMGPLAPTKITVTQVKTESLVPSVFGIGSVEARQSWLMGPTVAGRVLRVHVDVGQEVKAGQLLAEMDSVDLDQRLNAQDAALSKAKNVELIGKAQVVDTKARRELAHANFKRQQELARQNFISPAALEGRDQELQSADAAYLAAQANLQVAKQDSMRLQAERAAVALQRQNTKLIAPADAVVISRDAESGSTVVAGQPVLKLANPSSLWIKLRVDQGRSSGLEVGLPAQIVLRSRPQQSLMGKVARVELQADAVTEERIAQVSFDRMPSALSIGEMAEVTVLTQAGQAALTLPNAAIKQTPQGPGVWKLQEGKPVLAAIKVGQSGLDGVVEVLSGIAEGDEIIVHSERELREGGRIKVVEQLAGRKP